MPELSKPWQHTNLSLLELHIILVKRKRQRYCVDSSARTFKPRLAFNRLMIIYLVCTDKPLSPSIILSLMNEHTPQFSFILGQVLPLQTAGFL